MHRWRRPPDGFPSGARRRPGTASGEHPLRGGAGGGPAVCKTGSAPVQMRRGLGLGLGLGLGPARGAHGPSEAPRRTRLTLRPLPGAGPPPDTVLPGGAAWPSLTRARFPGSAGRLWPAQLSADLPFPPGAPPKAHGRMALRPVQCAPAGAGWGPELGLSLRRGRLGCGGGEAGRCAWAERPPAGWLAGGAVRERAGVLEPRPRSGFRRGGGPGRQGCLALRAPRSHHGGVDPTPPPRARPSERGGGPVSGWRAEGSAARLAGVWPWTGRGDPALPAGGRGEECVGRGWESEEASEARPSVGAWPGPRGAAGISARGWPAGGGGGKEEGKRSPRRAAPPTCRVAEARGRRRRQPAARSPQRRVRRDRQGVVQARVRRARVGRAKRWACQEWDSNPRLQGRLRPERSALDRSAILTAGLGAPPLAWLGPGADPGAGWRPCGCATDGRTDGRTGLASRSTRPTARRRTLLAPPPSPRSSPPPPPPSRGAHPAAGVRPPAAPAARRGPSPARGLRLARAALLAVSGVFSRRHPRAAGRGRRRVRGRDAPSRAGGLLCALTRRPGGRAGWAVARGTWRAPGRTGARDVEGPGGRGQAGRPAGGRAGGEGSGARAAAAAVLVSIVVSIPACHAGDRGSIPRRGGETRPLLVAGAAAALPKQARGDRGGPSCPPSTRPPAPPALPRRPWRPGALARAGSAQPSRDLLTGGWPPRAPRSRDGQLPGCRAARGGGRGGRADSEGPGAAGRRERPPEAGGGGGGRSCLRSSQGCVGVARVGRRAAAGGARDGAELRTAGTSGQGCGRRRRRWREGEEALVRSLGRRPGAARAVQRWWYSGEHSCLPSS
ncbi:collagen alpha-2(I) chain-like [Canis lupus familiaris]|uniref:collagen alpha-2(I) chain-like n=1 Tax=Canis lupus familiaris TaxID=9615 RepID=UPI0018F7E1CD|nr:collagen alpha-2(I) chain-like [Canis lupus familiaris]